MIFLFLWFSYIKMLFTSDSYILFFSQGDRLCTEFISPKSRPSFFWFYDSFYSHVSIEAQDRYLHVCVKKVKDLNFVFMQGIRNLDEAHTYFLETREKHSEAEQERRVRRLLFFNPPILRVYNTIVPEVIFDFEEIGNKDAKVIFPERLLGVRYTFFDENHFPIQFVKINGMLDLLPNLKYTFPISK